jgi:Protein of unknown function (DUF1616)
VTLKLEDYRNLLLAACLIALLLAALPAVSVLVTLPRTGERFSELFLLGPGHMAENYPFNITAGQPYSVYLGVGNRLGSSSYYAVYVKFRNQTQPLPNATESFPSPLPVLYEIRAFVQDGQTWEKLITFSIWYENPGFVNRLVINDRSVSTNSSAIWDSERDGFYYQLFFELWIYDTASRNLGFHNRFVTMWLNMT